MSFVVAKVLLVSPKGEVLVLRRSETDARRPLEGDLPGGWVDPGEDLIAAAMRETEEEAGIQIAFDALDLAYTHSKIVEDKGNTTWLFFIAKTDQTEVVLSPEHDQAEWVTLGQAIEKITYKIQNDFLVYVRDNNLLDAVIS